MDSPPDLESDKGVGTALKEEPAVEEPLVKPHGFWAKFRYYEHVLDRRLGIESNSVERVLPENRKPPNQVVMCFMWASGTMNLSCFSTGFLGKEFGLSLSQTIPITIFATLLGSLITVRSRRCSGVFAKSISRLVWLIFHGEGCRPGVRLWGRAPDCAKLLSPDILSASFLRPLSPF